MQTESGPVPGVSGTVDPRWVGTGRTIYNNKGLPVKKYEPYFSDNYDYEDEADIVTSGVTPIIFYDPLGRVVGTLHPDHTYEKVVFDPWQQETWDRNDTHGMVTTPTTDPDVGHFFTRLDSDLYGTDNYSGQVSTFHHGTYTTTFFDSLGRAFLTRQMYADETSTEDFDTRSTLDIEGNVLKVTDARGNFPLETAHDVAGRPVKTISPDAGDRVMFSDIAGQPVYTWDDRGHEFKIEYDALRRPIKTWLTENSTTVLVEKTIYGDSGDSELPASPENDNLFSRVYAKRDGAGKTTFAYDFKGNPLGTTSQLLADYKNTVDWSTNPEPTLETETFTTTFEYDALNRVVSKVEPDGSEKLPYYNEAGLLEGVDVILNDSTTATELVVDIDYNARGQRTSIEYGNGAVTEYEYDAATFRLTNLTTTEDSTEIQDLSYAYDPIGNITDTTDGAQQTVFFNNAPVSADGEYVYDSLYRLIEAKGREHPGQQPQPSDYTRYAIPHPNDTNALIRYTQTYAYDEVGNITQMRETVGNTWTQDYTYATDSNRLASTAIGGTTTTYSHDAHGNLAEMEHLDVMTWDPFDRLKATSAATSGQPTTYYVYDASGERVRKVTVNASGVRTKETIYLGGFEIFRDYQSDGTTIDLERETLHINDDTKRIAMVETKTIDSGTPVSSPSHLQRYQLDNHLGSACLELDASANVITYEEYYPFGGTSFHSENGSVSQKRYRYNGKEKDEETGLYYYGARYYAAWLGRWTACDPAGFVDGPNVYAYVRNNPVLFLDPRGCQLEKFNAMAINSMPESVQDAVHEGETQVAEGMVEDAKRSVSNKITEIKEKVITKYRKSAINLIADPKDWAKAKYVEPVHKVAAVVSNPKEAAKAVYDEAAKPYKEAIEEEKPLKIMGFAANKAIYALGAFATGVAVDKALNVKILNIGSGTNPMRGTSVRNVDIRPGKEVDIVADVEKSLPIKTGTINEVNSINPFEYNPVNEEVARVLKKGGVLKVTGSPANKNIKPRKIGSTPEELGLEKIYEGPMIDEHKFGTMKYTGDSEIPMERKLNHLTRIYRKK